jgi:hypothetical protein
VIRLLVKLGAWLDKRFPEKLVVRLEHYNELAVSYSQLGERHQALFISFQRLEDRIGKLEAHVAAVKDVIIKSGLREPTETERRRAAFVESGRMPE